MTVIPNVHGQFEIRRHGSDGHDGLLYCSYCGSITLAAFLAGLGQGARPELADRKYGYLHKIYLDHIPTIEHWRAYQSTEQVTKKSETGQATEKVQTRTLQLHRTTRAKFYTDHVKDGSEEDQKAYWTWLNGYVGARLVVSSPVQ